MSEPGVMECPNCRGEGLTAGPSECRRCKGVGIVPDGNVYPLRPSGLAKCGVVERGYPMPANGVALQRDGDRFVFRHQRGARGLEVWITLAELRDVHEQSGRLLEGVRDGERER